MWMLLEELLNLYGDLETISRSGKQVIIFSYLLELETDDERVLATEPWSFDKHIVIFQWYDASIPAKNLRFTTMKFWVQIHGLPVSMLDTEMAIELGETLGSVSPIHI